MCLTASRSLVSQRAKPVRPGRFAAVASLPDRLSAGALAARKAPLIASKKVKRRLYGRAECELLRKLILLQWPIVADTEARVAVEAGASHQIVKECLKCD